MAQAVYPKWWPWSNQGNRVNEYVTNCFINDVLRDRRLGGVTRVVSRAGGACKSRVGSFCLHFYHEGSRPGDSLCWLLGT